MNQAASALRNSIGEPHVTNWLVVFMHSSGQQGRGRNEKRRRRKGKKRKERSD